MADYKYFEASPHDLRARALWPMVLGVLVVCLSFFLPDTQGLSLLGAFEGGDKFAVSLSDSGKVFGISIITLFLVLVLGSRRRLSLRYRLKEAITVVGAVIVFAGGGAMVNEHHIKPYFESPRPNVVWLAEQAEDLESGFTVERYHARTRAGERSSFMKQALSDVGANVPPVVGEHWITEPGYSLPSGHAFASFFLATFFLFFATTFVASSRQVLFFLLVPWAVAVSMSRVLLNVHRPIDITVGAVQGLVVGIIAWLIVRVIIRKIVQIEMDR